MNYKGKKIEKTLLTFVYIIDVSDKEMKVVQVQNVRYVIQDEDDLVRVTHELALTGYTVQEIANFLNVSERKVRKYLEDCW